MDYFNNLKDNIMKSLRLKNTQDILALFYLAIFATIIIILSMKLHILNTLIIVFLTLLICSYILHIYYSNQYEDQQKRIYEKVESVKNSLNEILLETRLS